MIKSCLKKIYRRFNLFFRLIHPIIDLRRLFWFFPKYILFFRDFIRYRKMCGDEKPKFRHVYPCLYDNTSTTSFDRHYVYHPAWAVRIIRRINPEVHVDISSSLHFCTILSSFVKVRFYDFRPPILLLPDLEVGKVDLTNLYFKTGTIYSISCMHTIEHIGLGRYGDPIDPEGDTKALRELARVTAPGGHLLIVVPVGLPEVMFNGQRIYSYEWMISMFYGFDLREFSLIPDDPGTGIIWNADSGLVSMQRYGCGCFWFQKTTA
jgi:hypothetical protein